MFDVIIDETFEEEEQRKMESVLSDTTGSCTGPVRGCNSRLQRYLKRKFNKDIHAFECQFHINEILLKHVIDYVEGETTGPGRRAASTAYNLIPDIGKPVAANLMSEGQVSNLQLPVTRKALLAIQSKIIWYSERMRSRNPAGNNELFLTSF